MSAVDWAAHEVDLCQIDDRIPPMGSTYRTARACPFSLGQLWCTKSHKVAADPIHVAAHKNYGVVAVWSEEGGPPQINAKLAQRVGPQWLTYLFGDIEIMLIDPTETA